MRAAGAWDGHRTVGFLWAGLADFRKFCYHEVAAILRVPVRSVRLAARYTGCSNTVPLSVADICIIHMICMLLLHLTTSPRATLP